MKACMHKKYKKEAAIVLFFFFFFLNSINASGHVISATAVNSLSFHL